VGFLHVPQLPEQGDPSLPLADTIRAITAAIQSI
jgi:pyrrolidone-carboxylate peptidase